MAEIEDEIFQLAALMFPENASNLSVISKRIQPRVEAIIYKTIVFVSFQERFILRNMTYVEKFVTTLHSRSTEFFGTHVRDVCITNTVPKDLATLILAKCTGIQKLALWQRRDHSKLNIIELVTPLSLTLRSLSAGRNTFHQLAESRHIFPQIEYLDIGMLPVDMRIPSLDWLPALTTVQLNLGQQPFVDDQWVEDVKTVLFTTHVQFKKLLIRVNESCISDVELGVVGLGNNTIVVEQDSQLDPITEWIEAS